MNLVFIIRRTNQLLFIFWIVIQKLLIKSDEWDILQNVNIHRLPIVRWFSITTITLDVIYLTVSGTHPWEL